MYLRNINLFSSAIFLTLSSVYDVSFNTVLEHSYVNIFLISNDFKIVHTRFERLF